MSSDPNFFSNIADAIIYMFTHIINTYSGFLQVCVYFLMLFTFGLTLIKIYQSLRSLAHCDFGQIKKQKSTYNFGFGSKTPLSIIAAASFERAKKHYLTKDKEQVSIKMVPPDTFIKDAAFQFSERYFEKKFLEPISMLANLMPPLGFIGTILGMVIQFLSNSGNLKSDITVVGIATALYTTFIALIFYTFLEFLKRIFFSLAQKRIDEGLAAASRIGSALSIRESNET
jgi:biopolymer transport protein ExbB